MTNNTALAYPWADILYAMDAAWWRIMADDVRDFPGERYTSIDGITGVKRHPGSYHGLNSGVGAILLARYFGALRVILLGYDCSAAPDGSRHWHGAHKEGLKDAESLPKFASQFARAMDHIYPLDVVNASRRTALELWPRAAIEDALCLA